MESQDLEKIILDNLIDVKEDGSFQLNMDYFNYATGLTMTNSKFAKLFNIKRREPEVWLEQIHMDIAASLQAVTEEIVLKIAKYLKREFSQNKFMPCRRSCFKLCCKWKNFKRENF